VKIPDQVLDIDPDGHDEVTSLFMTKTLHCSRAKTSTTFS
jgi:hypothetical protein